MKSSRNPFASDIQIIPSIYCQLFKMVTSEFAQLFLKSQISTALQVVLEPLMEQHSSTIAKTPETATISLQ